MSPRRARVLTLSDLYPNPSTPTLGIYVEQQVRHLLPYCDPVVVAPLRLFPPLRVARALASPARLAREWREWYGGLARVPRRAERGGVTVHYPRYSSPPRQLGHALWGYFAYPFVRPLLRALHRASPFDLIHAHFTSPGGVLALLAARWMRVPVLLSVHGYDIRYTPSQHALSSAVVRGLLARVDRVAVNSRLTGEQVIGLGADPARVERLPLGASPPAEITPRSLRRAPEERVLVSIGNLFESKGHALVLASLRTLLDRGHRLRYVIVGEGPEGARLARSAAALGLAEHVLFVGPVSHDAIWSYLAGADLFVLPSWVEAFGVAYLEALSVGLPAIGCEGAGGPDDLAALGDCIVRVPPRDSAALTRAIERLLTDAERYDALADEGRRVVRDHYSWERCAERTAALYDELLARGAAP